MPVNMARGFVGCTSRAEDVVHDVFIKLIDFPKQDDVHQPAAYVARMVRNASIDACRYQSLENIYHADEEDGLDVPSPACMPEALAARSGGATPIADSRAIYRALDPALVARFAKRELLYVRNFGQGLDLPWQQAFGSDDPRGVERICKTRGIGFEWRDGEDGELLLRTRERCQAVARRCTRYKTGLPRLAFCAREARWVYIVSGTDYLGVRRPDAGAAPIQYDHRQAIGNAAASDAINLFCRARVTSAIPRSIRADPDF